MEITMNTIFKHEIKTSLKTLFIWVICVGGIGFACILLYSNMKDNIQDMAKGFASMGAFSDAFGMSQLNIATLKGYYATEIGTIHALGGSMFSAIISTTMLSKEEDGHTSEFLFSLPIARRKAVTAKWSAAALIIFLFQILCVLCYSLGILFIGDSIPLDRFIQFHAMQFLMNLEIAAICFAISAFNKKNKPGVGLGIVLLLYAYDMIARVVPDLSDYKFPSPFSYANAADILSTGNFETKSVLLGVVVLVVCVTAALADYTRRDLAI